MKAYSFGEAKPRRTSGGAAALHISGETVENQMLRWWKTRLLRLVENQIAQVVENRIAQWWRIEFGQSAETKTSAGR